ncbi:MAG: acetyl-CoA carboxylase, carboxyltransferase subunit beta [Pseudomonadota bacterium]
MSWLSKIPPGIKNIFRRDENDSTKLWTKCGNCGEMVFNRDLEAAHRVCPACDHHMTIGADARLELVFDNGAYQLIEVPEPPQDPLKFRDEKRYVDRLKDNRRKTGRNDAMVVAAGLIGAQPAVVSVQDFSFMGGSMGMALGEALLKAAEEAVARRAPLIVFAGSGGARMQEGILSLMQMPRTTIAVQMVKDAGLPYIVVLTHPTTGGVTASYAMLGDVHLAEPGALIGFAGPRVIEQTIREKLPEGFQRSEFLMEKGMVDMVVRRSEIRKTLGQLISVLMNSKTPVVVNEPEDDDAAEKTPAAAPASVAAQPNSSAAADLDKAAE